MASNELSRRTFFGCLAGAGLGATLDPGAIRGHAAPAGRTHAEEGRLNLCVFSKHLQFLEDYTQMAEVAAEIGFDGVDLTVRPDGHVEPERAARDLPRAVEAVRSAGLVVPTITTHITSADQEHARVVLETAAELEIPGYRMGYAYYDGGGNVEATLARLRPQMETLAVLNEDLGVHGDYQNHDGHYVGAPLWDIARLFDGLDPAWMGVQYDVRHATVEGANTWSLGLDLLAPRIHSLVVKDFRWNSAEAGATVEDVPLGRGHVNFADFWQRVKALNLRHPVSVHFEYSMPGSMEPLAANELRDQTVDVMRRDLAMLRKMLVQAGM